MESKLGLNFELVNRARASAAKIADDTQHFIDQHTTVTWSALFAVCWVSMASTIWTFLCPTWSLTT